MARKNWQRDIATAGVARIAQDREYAIVEMNQKGKLFVHEKTYHDRRIAIGRATRIANEAPRGDISRTYAVTRFGDKCVVYLDMHTVLYQGKC